MTFFIKQKNDTILNNFSNWTLLFCFLLFSHHLPCINFQRFIPTHAVADPGFDLTGEGVWTLCVGRGGGKSLKMLTVEALVIY